MHPQVHQILMSSGKIHIQFKKGFSYGRNSKYTYQNMRFGYEYLSNYIIYTKEGFGYVWWKKNSLVMHKYLSNYIVDRSLVMGRADTLTVIILKGVWVRVEQ